MNRYIAELIGTFTLALFGVGSAVLAGGDIGCVGFSFAFGIPAVAMACSIGQISGAHLNPAVSKRRARIPAPRCRRPSRP